MALVTLDNLHKSYGDRVLFDGLSFAIDKGERVGLIGDNGQGKTTLFLSIEGDVKPERGSVAIAKGARVGHLEQDPKFDPANTVMDEAELAFSELHQMSHDLRDLEHAMGEVEGEALEKTLLKYEKVQERFESSGGYAWRHKLEATLLGVGLGEIYWEQKVQTLSGGQRSRLALAKLLINAPDLLLLDEPTNHLDLAAIDWLENWLLDFAGAVLIISHDRYLLDRLATRIVWLTRKQLSSYPGNYSHFVEQREIQELTQQRQFEEQQADIEKQKEFIRRFGAGQRSKEAKGREKRLNRLLISDQILESVQVAQKISLQLGTEQRAGDRLLTVRDLAKSFGENVLWKDVRLDIGRGERIGIIGPNGSGKTTLLRVLIGKETADAGEVRWGSNLTTGYYDQRLDTFDPNKTVLEQITIGREMRKEKELRDALGAMRFSGDTVNKTIGLLSGGERARVALTALLLDRPNLLILDEPTNHLDVNSCEALEGALSAFEGTIICVSHDRYFLERVAKRMWVIDPPGLIDFDGGYDEWVTKKKKGNAPAAKAPPAKAPVKPAPAKQQPKSPPKKDNPYARQFGRLSVGELEKSIADTERSLTETEKRFASVSGTETKRLRADYDTLTEKLQALESEYFARNT